MPAQKRLEELKLEAQISPLPPVVLGGLLVVPIGLIKAICGQEARVPTVPDTQASAARARAIVMAIERRLPRNSAALRRPGPRSRTPRDGKGDAIRAGARLRAA